MQPASHGGHHEQDSPFQSTMCKRWDTPQLEEGCPSRFFLPMTAALEPAIAEIYTRLGLTEGALRTIATSRAQRDVYYACREMGQRPFSLPLGPLGVNCFASNRAEDHERIDAILAQEEPEGFAPAWFRSHGFEEEARYVAMHHTVSLGQ